MTGYNKKYGAYMTKEDKRQDIIFGIKKYMKIGYWDKVILLERELVNEYGMTEEEIDMAIYA